MKGIRIESAAPPFDRPVTARRAAGVLARAAAMGLVPPGAVIRRLDRATLDPVLRRIARAGVAAEPVAAWGAEADPLPLLARVEEALEGSPVPSSEWAAVQGVLGRRLLLRLLGVSAASGQRYVRGGRATPDDVAARLHFLALVIGELAGTYNDVGIRRWLLRPRTELGGKSPADRLVRDWSPEDAGPRAVRRLARSLGDAMAT
jgi:hypothetical protein